MRIVQAGVERAEDLTGVIARAMLDDPLVRWPFPNATEDLVRSAWVELVTAFAQLGALWETEGGGATAAWLGPEAIDGYAQLEQASRTAARRYADDDGVRYATLYDWVDAHLPEEPCWFLEIVAVDPAHQGRGLGSALVEHGLGFARRDGLFAFLATANPRNVPFYESFGFRVTEDEDCPRGGPHVWFMRWQSSLRTASGRAHTGA